MCIEPVETLLPRGSCVLGPSGDLGQRLRLQPARPPLSIAAATDQARPLEDLQMTGDGRETDRERLGQLEHGCLTVGQPRRVGSDKAAKMTSNRSGAVTAIVGIASADTSWIGYLTQWLHMVKDAWSVDAAQPAGHGSIR